MFLCHNFICDRILKEYILILSFPYFLNTFLKINLHYFLLKSLSFILPHIQEHNAKKDFIGKDVKNILKFLNKYFLVCTHKFSIY